AAARNVLVRRHHLAPRLEVRGRLAFDRVAGALARSIRKSRGEILIAGAIPHPYRRRCRASKTERKEFDAAGNDPARLRAYGARRTVCAAKRGAVKRGGRIEAERKQFGDADDSVTKLRDYIKNCTICLDKPQAEHPHPYRRRCSASNPSYCGVKPHFD